jgi:hypothetical protein
MFAFQRARLRAAGTCLKPVLAISLAALLAACSSAKQPAGPQVFAWLAPKPSQPQPLPIERSGVEIEDDGLPAQAAPSAGIRHLPDDPRAPWSPNYGRSDAGVSDRPAAPGDVLGCNWTAVTTPAAGGVPLPAEDDGLPRPQSPEEAGVVPQAQMRRERRAWLAPAWTRCPDTQRWKCGR